MSTDYKSILHYLALQPPRIGLSFEEFLLFFTHKDIGKLDVAISETLLRNTFHERLGSFYNSNEISCLGEFKFIINFNLALVKCDASELSIGRHRDFCIHNLLLLILFCYRRRGNGATTISITRK